MLPRAVDDAEGVTLALESERDRVALAELDAAPPLLAERDCEADRDALVDARDPDCVRDADLVGDFVCVGVTDDGDGNADGEAKRNPIKPLSGLPVGPALSVGE